MKRKKLLASSSCSKNTGFAWLELLFVIVVVIAIAGGFYLFKYTDLLNGLFASKVQSGQNNSPQFVTLPTINHNQIVVSVINDSVQISPADGKLLFAFDNKLKVATEWPIDAGFLVKSYDGIRINLLGYNYLKTNKQLAKDGYDALQDLDINGDNKLDDLDIDYEHLYVWQDVNHNAVVDEGELKKLLDLDIIAIDLNSMQPAHEKVSHSMITRKLTFIKEDNSKGTLFDIDLFQNPYYRQYLIKLPLTDEVSKLPNVEGTGAVRDLQEAAELSPKLQALLIDYLVASTPDRRFIRMDKLLFEWAKTSDLPSFEKRLNNISTSRFSINLGDGLVLHDYEEGLHTQQDLLREILVIECFRSKKLLYFFGQEILNVTSQLWELHLTISLERQVITSQVISANKNGSKKEVIISANMLKFTTEQTVDIHNQYNQIKRAIFDKIQAKANTQLVDQLTDKPAQWIDLKLQNQIQTGEIYQQKQAVHTADLPRRRNLVDCIKPNNVVDEQVIDCAAGKISKTW